jgi:hypothetical protein
MLTQPFSVSFRSPIILWCGKTFSLSLSTFLYVFKQSAIIDYFEGEVRQRIKNYICSGGLVLYRTGFEIDLKLVTVVDLIRSVGRLNQVEAVIDSIAIEDSRKRLRDDDLDTRAADSPDSVLSR